MKKVLFLIVIIIFLTTASIFAQPGRTKRAYWLPEVNDEVLLAARRKQVKNKTAKQQKSTKRQKPFFDEADALFGKRRKSSAGKYANQEVGYRKRAGKKKVRSLTHDPDFEDWAHRKRNTKKIRRKN